MRCPRCQEPTKVVNSRQVELGRIIKRRRECLSCRQRFSTHERVTLADLRVLKRDGSREPYTRHKIEAGLRKALEKRSVGGEQFQKLILAIENDIFALEKNPVASEQIGKIVLSHLKGFDKVGYLRFASVYRQFKSPRAFEKEIKKLVK